MHSAWIGFTPEQPKHKHDEKPHAHIIYMSEIASAQLYGVMPARNPQITYVCKRDKGGVSWAEINAHTASSFFLL